MGVPVIRLSGERHAGRVGASLLSAVGKGDLIARSQEEYVTKAVNLAGDVREMKRLREMLRDMMRSSALCDERKFAGNLEKQYRRLWQRWCGKQAASMKVA